MINLIIKIDMSIKKLKNTMYVWKKPLDFVKSVKSVTFCENHCSIIVKKLLKKHDVPFTKTVTFCESCFFADGLMWKSVWKLTSFPFFVQKQLKKDDVPWIKTVTFCGNCHFFPCAFSWNSLISPFALFLVKKHIKNDVTFRKTVTFCKICRFFESGFSWNSVWIFTFSPFVGQKITKKARCTLQKNCYVLWKLSLFYGRFFLEFCLKSHFFPLFLLKNN